MRNNTVFCDVEIATYDELLAYISKQFCDVTRVSYTDVLRALKNRESAGSTYLENGVAYPHGRLKNFDDLVILFVRSQKPIIVPHSISEFSPQASCFFSMLASSEDVSLYLKMIQSVAKLVQAHSKELHTLKSKDELLELFATIELEEDYTISAKDLMSTVLTISQESSMAQALDCLSQQSASRILVLNARNKRIVGHLTFDTLLRYSMPEYISHMKSLSFSSTFDPLREIWQKEHTTKIKYVMDDCQSLIVHENTKYFEILHTMLQHHSHAVYVVNHKQAAVGVVTEKEILHKLFRS